MSVPPKQRDAASRRWWIWLPLLGVGGWLAVFGDKTPSPDEAVAVPIRPAPRPAGTAAPASPSTAGAPATAIVADASARTASAPLVLLPREALVRPAPPPQSAASAAPRDLFGTRSWNPPPPPPPPPAPPPPPMAPPLPFTFLGKKLEGDAWEVYLGRGEQSFVVREGTVLEGTYRVDRIAPPVLSLTYLPLAQVQTLAIGETR